MTFEQTIRQIIREEMLDIFKEIKSDLQPHNHDDYPPLLKVEDAAKLLQISKTRVYELAHQPDFPVIREGRKIRIPTHRLFSWIDEQEQLHKSMI